MIYAPNGIMKTSFANTFSDICTNTETRDCFYPDKVTKRIIKYDSESGNDISGESILVIEPYSETYKSEKTSVLLANAKLKKEYEMLLIDISTKFKSLSSAISSASGKRDISKILSEDFSCQEKEYYDCLEKIYDQYHELNIVNYSKIKYGKIVNADSEKILNDPDVLKQLDSYIQEYEKLITTSVVFNSVYNHTNAETSLSALSKSGFFKAQHQILLHGRTEGIDEKHFKQVLHEEKTRIIDKELAEEFQKIDAILSSKIATKEFRDFIFEHKEIIPELADFSAFKQKLWISYLFDNFSLFQLAILTYKNNKKKLNEIVEQAKNQISDWNNVVDQFNERFSNMPFKLAISNKEDVILKNELPIIYFKYNNRNQEVEIDEHTLLAHLSNGEKKALYLLNIIFEIEGRKKLNIPTFIIIDDIADSFDYRNKYAIIEYIKDICDNNLFMPIILTHNFDFYRTVAGRVDIKPTSNFVSKSESELKLVHGQYFKNVFDTWRENVYTNNAIFISSIAFIRNIVEYTSGKEDEDYINLTSLLHYKPNPKPNIIPTTQFYVHHLISIYHKHWGRDVTRFNQTSNALVYNIIVDTADGFTTSKPNEIFIQNKIVLSIAIRLLSEKYMMERINTPALTNVIEGNQTRELRNLIHFNLSDPIDKKRKEIIERVLIITSENIHINSFMYEPIVDLSLDELLKLYTDVKQYLK